ncbi:PDZ domain-containing protein [Planosporangium sp. 12N6]|uniref:YlbL family protein n=1 Tax=Planosporangium spinosum TaxID=3402278 RepID=UPI003CF818A0
MRRRGATVLLGGVLLVLLLWQAFFAIQVPYVALGPGPTVNTLGQADKHDVISVTGAPVSSSTGQLRLTTVSVTSNLTLFEAVKGWIQHDYAVVPRELIYPPDQTEQQVDQQNAQEFKDSQTSAETAALTKLGYPVQVTVAEVRPDTPAAGVLQTGDVITAVDGSPVTTAATLTELIRAKPAGTARTVAYTRAGAAGTATITPRAEDGNPRIGVTVESKQPHPFQLKIDLDKIGGPSAGLMFTLGIIDKLDPTDLTGGKVIAGTGTIDDAGKVGSIGGIPQKLVAAKRDGATVFLTPAGNCAEAMANAVPGLPLAKVATVDDALAALQAVREHRQPALCTR